jgi:Domain of unknown function (DUF1707)/Cell wall-active antibiotics response 4TMS YvqF
VSLEAAEPYEPRKLRASDADRERVAQVLHTALAEGRLTVAELQERLDSVYAAKTLGELEPVTRDLPGHTDLVPRPPAGPAWPSVSTAPTGPARLAANMPASPDARVGGTPTSTAAIALMSGATRKGQWVIPGQFSAVALMGGVDLDLTEALFAEREVTITAVAIMGGVDIVVPDDITVIVSGIGFMGAFEDNAQVQGTPGGPVVRINGLALMGGVDVHRRKRRRGEIET